MVIIICHNRNSDRERSSAVGGSGFEEILKEWADSQMAEKRALDRPRGKFGV